MAALSIPPQAPADPRLLGAEGGPAPSRCSLMAIETSEVTMKAISNSIITTSLLLIISAGCQYAEEGSTSVEALATAISGEGLTCFNQGQVALLDRDDTI